MNKIGNSYFKLVVMNDLLDIYYFNGNNRVPLLYGNFKRCEYTSIKDLLDNVTYNRDSTLLIELFKCEVENNKRNLTKFLELISTPSEYINLDKEYDNFAFIMPTKLNFKFDVESVYKKIGDSSITVSFNFINDIFNFNFRARKIHKDIYEDEDALLELFTKEGNVKYIKNHIKSSLRNILMIDNVADNYLDYLVHHIYENLKVFIRLNPTINTTLTIRLPDALGINGQIIKE